MSSQKDAFSQGQRTEPPKLGKQTSHGLNSDNMEKKMAAVTGGWEEGLGFWNKRAERWKGGAARLLLPLDVALSASVCRQV